MSVEQGAETLWGRARRAVAKIAEANASPSRLFAACVVGGILGSTPFFGLHFFLCVGAAWLLRLNPVAVYGAANISIPPIAPFLAFACISVGSRVVRAPISLDQLRHVNPWTLATNIFVAWMIGAVVVGGSVGAVLGAIVARVAVAKRERAHRAADPFAVAADEAVARFADARPGHRYYVRWKIRLDPVYRAICNELPDRVELVELGCGLGILPLLVVSLGSHRHVTGVDWDEPKVEAAKKASRGLPITIERGDVRTWEPPPCDAIAIVDVLHYFDAEVQKQILERAVRALREGGTLFVREGESGDKGSAWTRVVERLAVAFRWNKSDERPRFRAIDEIVRELTALGLTCEVVPVSGPLHPGNVLVRATRASAT